MGEIENGEIEVVEGDILTFTNEKVIGNKEKLYVSYPNFHSDVKIGNIILIDDGKLEVRVLSIEKNNDVKKVVVTLGGALSSKRHQFTRYKDHLTSIDEIRSCRS